MPAETGDKLLPLLETVVEDGRHGATLQGRRKSGARLRTGCETKVSVTTPRLGALAGSGCGDVDVGPLQTPTPPAVVRVSRPPGTIGG